MSKNKLQEILFYCVKVLFPRREMPQCHKQHQLLFGRPLPSECLVNMYHQLDSVSVWIHFVLWLEYLKGPGGLPSKPKQLESLSRGTSNRIIPALHTFSTLGLKQNENMETKGEFNISSKQTITLKRKPFQYGSR